MSCVLSSWSIRLTNILKVNSLYRPFLTEVSRAHIVELDKLEPFTRTCPKYRFFYYIIDKDARNMSDSVRCLTYNFYDLIVI